MTSKAALCIALLRGDVVSIRSGFNNFGITNIPREIGRSIKRAFDVEVSKVMKESENRYGCYCCWAEYRLNKTEYNKPGIQKMRAYVKGELKNRPAAKTQAQEKTYKQLDLWVATWGDVSTDV